MTPRTAAARRTISAIRSSERTWPKRSRKTWVSWNCESAARTTISPVSPVASETMNTCRRRAGRPLSTRLLPSRGQERPGDDLARLVEDPFEVLLAPEALGVELVDVLGSRRAGREPAARGRDLEAADGRVVPRGAGEPRHDGLAAQLARRDVLGREAAEPLLLFGRRRRIDAPVVRRSEALEDFPSVLARVAPGARGDLGCQEPEHE